jgi:hypothetical protein
MAGRFQGYHNVPNNRMIEIFLQGDGWWWWPRADGRPPDGEPVGPFITSTEAYLNASGGTVLMPSPNQRRATAY